LWCGQVAPEPRKPLAATGVVFRCSDHAVFPTVFFALETVLHALHRERSVSQAQGSVRSSILEADPKFIFIWDRPDLF